MTKRSPITKVDDKRIMQMVTPHSVFEIINKYSTGEMAMWEPRDSDEDLCASVILFETRWGKVEIYEIWDDKSFMPRYELLMWNQIFTEYVTETLMMILQNLEEPSDYMNTYRAGADLGDWDVASNFVEAIKDYDLACQVYKKAKKSLKKAKKTKDQDLINFAKTKLREADALCDTTKRDKDLFIFGEGYDQMAELETLLQECPEYTNILSIAKVV